MTSLIVYTGIQRLFLNYSISNYKYKNIPPPISWTTVHEKKIKIAKC